MANWLRRGFGCSVLAAVFFWGGVVHAASLSIGPATGTVTVDSTFDISLFVNTEGDTVNALEVSVSFPPDKLQLVSPTAGKSVIELWTGPPRFNNLTGRIDLQGGIPGGLKVSQGQVIKLTFRARSVGTALVKFLDNSKVLNHDGRGTDVLGSTSNGIYQIELPPPAGPAVVATTHPIQGQYFATNNAQLQWASNVGIDAYSYVLNKESTTIPDDIPEGRATSVAYQNLADGVHYFHIKALRHGAWGGVTHLSLGVDVVPPAEFSIEVIPQARTTRRQPVIQFATTDSGSGLSHYELKLVPLNPGAKAGQQFFVEAQSPYIPPQLEMGSYDVIVRAYDHAKNIREVTRRLEIVPTVFRIVRDEGLELKSNLIIPWPWVWGVGGVLLVLLGLLAYRARRFHRDVDRQRGSKELPETVRKQLEDLKKYRTKYGQMVLLLALVSGLLWGNAGFAQTLSTVPPLVTTVSRHITNEEIFYAGGRTQLPNAEVIIYLQNLSTGETFSRVAAANDDGEWFYRHERFLSSGSYLLWVQGRAGETLSPPSPQEQLTVEPTALQFGASRVSFATLYLTFSIALLLGLLGLSAYTIVHAVHGRRKHRHLIKEIHEAEESVKRGFAVLRRDLEAELALTHRAKLSKELSDEERVREKQLQKDLAWVEKYIGKEVWDIEKTENRG
ncbi:MAG: Uncharacterized protein G01um101431_809 [Parcubacteria group bacterium Gr01-1014_31]|nr:MAG: Uncharacterized protein G01um101431_809 [Parcubacteria group bacterium Gr01-1014_31]